MHELADSRTLDKMKVATLVRKCVIRLRITSQNYPNELAARVGESNGN